nr:RNA-directed DNA polymerase (reverse transcriptase) domain containing protein [Haemonchus contortus]
MDTPLSRSRVQERPVKRSCIDRSPPMPSSKFDQDVALLMEDQSLPQHLRSVLGILLEDRKFLHSVLCRNRELAEEVSALKAENAKLKAAASGAATPNPLTSQQVAEPSSHVSNVLPLSPVEVERKRSIVLIGVPESYAQLPSERLVSDIKRRSFKDADYNAIRAYLAGIDWYASFGFTHSVDDMYELFLAILQHCISLYVPIIHVPLSRLHLPSYLRRLYNKRRQAWVDVTLNDTPESRSAFRRLNVVFERKLFKYNCSVERKVIESSDKNAFYKYVRSRLNSRPKLGCLRGYDGLPLHSDKDKAEILASTFEKAFAPSASEDLTDLSGLDMYPVMPDSAWVQADDLLAILLRWPSSCSLTPDEIPTHFIKNVAHVIVGPLQYICNLSFMRSEIPSRWKMAYVTPIPKKAPYDCPDNYRPISITSIFARAFEKILKKKIVAHIMEHSILSPFQHGFQEGKSTVTALLESLNNWTTSLDEGISVDVVYLDFLKLSTE